MPDGDSTTDDNFKLNIDGVNGSENDEASNARARLAQEAQEMRRAPLRPEPKGIRDVTAKFFTASKQLPSGELVKDDFFTLFEAVGALEIMDPKMDSGFIPPGDTFEPDFDVSASLNAGQVLWVMDELFRLEMSVHDGYPLSQNIFTSLHIFQLISPENKYPYRFALPGSRPDLSKPTEEHKLVHVVLRAYCIAVVKCCQLAFDIIQSQIYYEEEDFVTFMFGRDFLPSLPPDTAMDLLDDGLRFVENSRIDTHLASALTHRLIIRQKLLASMEGDIDQWQVLKAYVGSLYSAHEKFTPVPEAFSTKVQRKLATSSPPRPMPEISWEQACEKWKQLCDDVVAAYNLTTLPARLDPHCLQRATWTFSYRDPAPNTFARAKMQEILVGKDRFSDELPHYELLLSDIRNLVLAGDPLVDPASFQVELTSDPRHKSSRILEEFIFRAIGEYMNLYRIVCQNHCRMRRAFSQAVSILDILEVEARETDKQLNAIIGPRCVIDESGKQCSLEPMTLWTRHYKLQVMEWVVQLGFETDIYLPDELNHMYNLLDCFVEKRRNQLQQLEGFVTSKIQTHSAQGNGADREECLASRDFVKSLILQTDTTHILACALGDIYAMLGSLSILSIIRNSYAVPQLRYEARMKPFLNLQHDDMPGLESLENRKRGKTETITQFCSRIDLTIKKARSHLTELKNMSPTLAKYVGTEDHWKNDIKKMQTVCVAISVTVSQLLRTSEKQGKKGSKTREDWSTLLEVTLPPPGQRYHDWWVVPQLKQKH